MKSSVDILDAIAKKLGGASDYRIWKETGIYHGTISSVRAGRCSLSRENCAKAAEILGVEVGALIAIVTAEREENTEPHVGKDSYPLPIAFVSVKTDNSITRSGIVPPPTGNRRSDNDHPRHHHRRPDPRPER